MICAAALGWALLLVGCSTDPDDADRAPFFLWGARPGMQLDSVEQIFIRQDNVSWFCEDLGAGVRRCRRPTRWVYGRLEAVAAADGRVLYLAFAPDSSEYGTGRDVLFDEDLAGMERVWTRARGVRFDPHGVSEASPKGTVDFTTPRSHWKALVTFDGRLCTGLPRPCPALVQLVDWRDGRAYVQP